MKRALIALAALLPFGAAAQAQDSATGFRPHLAQEVDIGLYTVGTTRATDPARRGTTTYLYGELAAGLHLAPNFSIQGVLAFEPIGEGDALGGSPGGGTTFFRRQSAFLEALFLEWKPDADTTLQAGRFVAPFGRGHHDFPGILTRIRAHEVNAITDSLGFGASHTFYSDLVWGEHDISAAVFTLDRSFLSSTLATRRSCCDEAYERFNRNTRAQGGPGNTGQLDNAALALDGDGFAWAPGLSYHLGVLTRGAGDDGTAREWGYTAALRYEQRWSPTQRTLFFAEGVQFRNAAARPRTEITLLSLDPDTGDEIEDLLETGLRERRTFTTLGVQHRIGDWRGTLAWQRDQRKRSVETLPTENYLEASVGTDLPYNFTLDAGYQYGRYAREDAAGLGTSHALLLRVGWRGL
ncbi:hypothetical protein HB662_07025 [Roseomonas frigidaquae]|uniref:Porin n=1 Tax=Falsiroseomonas frigidaquae TaxID=487318 RepID=A0ABX1EWS8_9PROT|nr:hypothetical protein [Falsiroseomonas frigidaquae]NKE44523.1 hypothetical protein [Falsiroseomonas frigidaquae]